MVLGMRLLREFKLEYEMRVAGRQIFSYIPASAQLAIGIIYAIPIARSHHRHLMFLRVYAQGSHVASLLRWRE